MVQVGDSFITVDEDIGQHVVNYYETLFTVDDSLSTDYSLLDCFSWNLVTDDQNNMLVATLSEEEIHDAVFGLDASSSLGPDGFG